MKFWGIPVDNKVTGINNIISPLETQALPSKPQKLDTLGLIFLGGKKHRISRILSLMEIVADIPDSEY